MSDELNEIQSITHEYRKSLAAYEARTGRAPQTVDQRGSGEERQKFAAMDADLDAIESRAKEASELKSLRERIAKLESQPVLESRSSTRPLGDKGEQESARWLKAMVSNDQAELRALSLSTSNAGIPTDMERRIVQRLWDANVMRQIAPVTQIDSKRTITVENALPTTSLIGEASAIGSPGDPSFGTAVSVVPYKYATRVILSQEFIEDGIGQGGIGSVLDYVANRCALSIALKQEEAYVAGTGSSQPEGIAGSSTGKPIAQGVDLGSGAALTTLTADNLIDALFTVKPVYRNSPRFRWLLSDSVLKTIRKLKNTGSTTTSGAYATEFIWTPGTANANSMVGGIPATVLGVPYSVSQYVPTTTGDNTVYAVIGDFNYFEIFDRTGITSVVDPYSLSNNHQTALIMYTRTDSHIMLAEAFAYIRG
jgi:HK97 family phage major capsid protein